MPTAPLSRTRSEEALAGVLKALASPNRLALLRQLRQPRIQREIRLGPEDQESGAPRPITRQAVSAHLEKLVEANVVVSFPVQREFGETAGYLVNHQRLFAISEEFRELANLRPVKEALDQPTVEDARSPVSVAVFPRLLMVRGLREGVGYGLQPAPGRPDDAWIVGRKRDSSVPVDYDPYVSLENTLIAWRRGEYLVQDLPQSRNGTTLNFERLEPGRDYPLAHGDVLGMGRTLFVFQTRADPKRPR